MLREEIKRRSLLKEGDRCVVALSGGRDSVCLLFLMCSLRQELSIHLSAVHINHGLRKEAALDEAFCIALCQRLGVSLLVYREDVLRFAARQGIGLEEAGRQLRYQRLGEAARFRGASAVLTAHHQGDQAETVLLNLLRGSGLNGLKGMPLRRPLVDSVQLIRPLLGISGEELEAYLEEAGESWREDSSNQDSAFSRNLIRAHLKELIRQRFPQAEAQIARSADLTAQAQDYLEKEAVKWIRRYEKQDLLPLKPMQKMHSALRYYVWKELFRRRNWSASGEEFHELKALPEKNSGSRILRPGVWQVLREQEGLRLLSLSRKEEEESPPLFHIRSFPYQKDLKIPDSLYTKWVDYDIMSGGLCLRHRKEGDFFYLPDGSKKSVSRYMIDRKIPAGLRDSVWLLAEGSHVIWLVGYRLCCRARIGPETKTVAEICLEMKGEVHGKACGETVAERGKG